MVTVKFVKRTRMLSGWVLPGSRMEFANAGIAGTYVRAGAGEIVNKRGRPPKHKAAADSRADSGAGNDAGDASGSETQPAD